MTATYYQLPNSLDIQFFLHNQDKRKEGFMKIKKKVKLISLIFTLIAYFASPVLCAEESISEDQARKIANNFIKIEKQNFPSWMNVSIKALYNIYSSNGYIVGYEISVHDKGGNDRGYIIVSSDKNKTIIPSFSENGLSISGSLFRYYENDLKQLFESLNLTTKEMRILGNLPFHFAIGIKFQELDYIDNANFIVQDGWFIFSPNPNSHQALYKKNYKRNYRKLSLTPSSKENRDFYNALINGDENSKFFKKISSGKINNIKKIGSKSRMSSPINEGTIDDGTVDESSKLFSNIYQENREWTKGGVKSDKMCYAGCGPVAWAILLEYWDRNGYPNLISSKTDNSNRFTTDPDIRWSINELRGYLETTCSDDGGATTWPWDIDQGDEYIKARGYKSNVYSNTLEPGFWQIIEDINANRPPIALFDLDDGGVVDIPDHYVVVYAYEDKSGTANDRFKAKNGWQITTDSWYSRETITLFGAGITSLIITSSPSSPPKPYFDGAGSLVDPQNKDNSNDCGCKLDYVKLHSHKDKASAGFFQVFRIPGVCESISLNGLDSASIEVRSWTGRGNNSKYYSIHGNSTIPLLSKSIWNLVAFKTNQPIKKGTSKIVAAVCRGDNNSDVTEVSGNPMILNSEYHWGGNGSIINHSNNQFNSDTQAGYGRNRDTAVLLKSNKTLSVFQVTNTQSCRKVKFSTRLPFNLSWKTWNEKDWQGSKKINNEDTFIFPTSDYWWILKAEAPASSSDKARIDVVCEH